jgi:hypothetical protein
MVSRYPDPDRTTPFVWYDVPGAGTIGVPKWRYFNDHGLYIFDCLIVVYNDRFSDTDVAILENCGRFGIPSYIVRSKSDIHVNNLVKALPDYDSDDDEHDYSSPVLGQKARDQYIEKTRWNVHDNLEKAGLPQQRVYLVSRDTLLATRMEKPPEKNILLDEHELLKDLYSEAYTRLRSKSHFTINRPSPNCVTQ